MSSSNLSHIVNSDLRWVFVGGKGGVGKTTTSSSLAIQIAHRNHALNHQTLILSTDPAHNLSDAFSQQFTASPTPVTSVPGLFAMEINPQKKFKNAPQNPILDMFSTTSLPGMDELMSFMEVMEIANSNTFKTVIFDTAPTGHTLRFLEIPQVAKQLKGVMSSMLPMLQPIMAMAGGGGQGQNFDQIMTMFDQCEEIEKQFQNADLTQFVAVCIPEFLSLYETERLIQHLARLDIDCGSVVVNQVLGEHDCDFCRMRRKMQQKYILQMRELYEDFALVFQELGGKEVRGVEDLEVFGRKLVE